MSITSMNSKYFNIALCILLLLPLGSRAKRMLPRLEKTSHFTFKTQFLQFKDAFNYGLTFSGVSLVAGYSRTWELEKHQLRIDTEMGFGPLYNKGIGLAWRFKPIDLFYGFKRQQSDRKPLTIGPYLSALYNWQIYPELQSGHMFWFSSYALGARLISEIHVKEHPITLSLSNSAIGWVSRPVPATETYFYALELKDFATNAHQNLTLASSNVFNHTQLRFAFRPKPGKRRSMAYEFEYFGYYQDPRLSYIHHSINFSWKLGKR